MKFGGHRSCLSSKLGEVNIILYFNNLNQAFLSNSNSTTTMNNHPIIDFDSLTPNSTLSVDLFKEYITYSDDKQSLFSQYVPSFS
jgi:hypothetical protein